MGCGAEDGVDSDIQSSFFSHQVFSRCCLTRDNYPFALDFILIKKMCVGDPTPEIESLLTWEGICRKHDCLEI